MADELERPEETSETHEHDDPGAHLPPPTIWPFAFAGAVAVILVGLIVSMWAAVVGVVLAVVFGFLWIRDVTRDVRAAPEPEPVVAPEPSPLTVEEGEPAEPERYPRSKFLEGATLGLGAVIGGIVTVPALGFAVAPAFVGQEEPDVDLGAMDNYPEGEWRIATFTSEPEKGDVTRRTAFIRYNGLKNEVPSYTIIFNRCVHLGCPTQPQGPPGEPAGGQDVSCPGDADADTAVRLRLPLPRRRLRHRGQPDGRAAGPRARPLRVLDHQRQPLARRAVQRRGGRG